MRMNGRGRSFGFAIGWGWVDRAFSANLSTVRLSCKRDIPDYVAQSASDGIVINIMASSRNGITHRIHGVQSGDDGSMQSGRGMQVHRT